MTRAERLLAYVEAAEGVPAGWDECSTWPAQWVADEIGAEFDWPVYADEAEGRRLVDKAGGLVHLWGRVAKQARLPVVHDFPRLGDVGVIETQDHGQVGGIFADGGAFCWRSLNSVRIIGPRGYILQPGPDGPVFRPVVLKVWRV